MSNQFIVAAVQMVSGDNVQTNIQVAAKLAQQAKQQGAELIVLPEYFCHMGADPLVKTLIAEDYGDGPIQQALSALAKNLGVWLIGGTLPIKSPSKDHIFNTQLVFSSDGEFTARYDKIHLFDFNDGQERFDESELVMAGHEPQTAHMPFGTVGLSTCYDLRFPELYRALGIVDLIVVPSAFTETTGRAHWETLLRARAIENQTYVLAAAQGGVHPGLRRTWGHSMLIDPWGEIITTLELGEGVVVGEVNHARLRSVRASLPALSNRVL